MVFLDHKYNFCQVVLDLKINTKISNVYVACSLLLLTKAKISDGLLDPTKI